MAKFIVWSLDVLGHGPEDCQRSYDCPCIVNDEETGEYVHDAEHNECDAEFCVNDRCRVGEIELTNEMVDAAILRALIDGRFLAPDVTMADITIDGDDIDLAIYETNGRPVFQLEREE